MQEHKPPPSLKPNTLVKPKPKIVACLPAYNEEKTIAKVIILTQKYADEVIVVDDGSTDMTAKIAEKLGAIVLKHVRNMGKGIALKTALSYAKKLGPDIVVILDADGQHDPDEIPKLIQPIIEGKADLVIGSRYVKGAEANIPTYRKIGLAILNILSKTSIKTVKDTQSGFRAFKAKYIDILTKYEAKGYGVEMEQLAMAQKHGLKIIEVPVTIRYDVEKPSKKNPIVHGLELIATLTRLVTLERPLIYLGIPSAAMLVAGATAIVYLILLFNETRYFSIPIAIISLGLILLGTILATAALTFHALSIILKKIETK